MTLTREDSLAATTMSTDVDKKINPQSYFDDDDPHFDNDARLILTQYSGIPEPSLVPHVRAIVRRVSTTIPQTQ